MTRDHHPSVCGASRISESCPTTVSGASGIQRCSSAFTSLLDSIQRPPRSTASWCVPPYLARMHRFNSGKSGPSARKLPGSPEGSPVDAGNFVTKFRRLGNDSPPKNSYRFVRRAEERVLATPKSPASLLSGGARRGRWARLACACRDDSWTPPRRGRTAPGSHLDVEDSGYDGPAARLGPRNDPGRARPAKRRSPSRAPQAERPDAGRHESRPRRLRASRRETRAARRTFARLAAAAVRGCGVSAPESVVRPSGATWSISGPWLGGGGLSTPGNGGDDSLSATARRGGESAKLIS